jgi:hypothetical protein
MLQAMAVVSGPFLNNGFLSCRLYSGFQQTCHNTYQNQTFLFMAFSFHSNTFFCHTACQVTDASSIKCFISTSQLVRALHLSSSPVWNFCPPKYAFIGRKKRKSLEKSGLVFQHITAKLLSENLSVWKSILMQWGRSSLRVSLVFSFESIGAHHHKASYCNTV